MMISKTTIWGNSEDLQKVFQKLSNIRVMSVEIAGDSEVLEEFVNENHQDFPNVEFKIKCSDGKELNAFRGVRIKG